LFQFWVISSLPAACGMEGPILLALMLCQIRVYVFLMLKLSGRKNIVKNLRAGPFFP
jgi:hypothetical protein